MKNRSKKIDTLAKDNAAVDSMTEDYFPSQDLFTLRFKDRELEREFCTSYDKSVRFPLRMGIIISILSWYSAILLIYLVIPEHLLWLGSVTFVYIGSYFGFLIYATYNKRFAGYYHLLGAISNAWAGLFTIYFCDFFPNGVNLMLPVIVFIIFFGSYMIRLRWLAGFIAALTYIVGYQVYLLVQPDLSFGEVIVYSFVSWMVLIFALLAGRTAENNYRISYIQRKTIRAQNAIIEQEKDLLLKEVHHRVQNNLQMIISLINLQLRKSLDIDASGHNKNYVREALQQAQGRVLSMSLVHQRIHQSTNFSRISVREYAENLKHSIAQQHRDKQIVVELGFNDDIKIDIERAIPLGLLLNEMISAAYEVVETGSPGNLVKVTSSVDASGKYTLTFLNQGHHFPENHRDSLEHELIEILTEQLEGTLKCWNDAKGAMYEVVI